ncbi:nuclear valosin-containing protein-like isoform X2 [Phymastichus coffea]|uniref:nuclear valosin-containing protein-like isoform X2 n=1 Tax=Phymastichus coffea TaxID=108790 RepID=UPI00273AA86E|nr:nuclear valosin-containing protein-like isoform X2 [Phymastichus coffea]
MMHKLEKLNSSIDIIPLQSSTSMDNNAAARRKTATTMDKPLSMQQPQRVEEPNARIFRDPMILSRVKTYLYENEDKVYIDVTEMADCLQRKYRDYRNKKRGPFRTMVRKAYDEITENLTRQADTRWQDDDDEIDIDMDTMPSQYLPTFKCSESGRQNGNFSDKELIDISSDDDQVNTTTAASVHQGHKDQVEVELTQVTKRPHLEPNIQRVETIRTIIQPEVIDSQYKTNQSKSRKRPRDKDDIPVDLPVSKKKPKDLPVMKPTLKFADIGGNNNILETVANLLLHLKHPEVYTKLGISPPRGFLLHGPPGCGKTLLAHAIAGELSLPLLKIAAPELVAGVSGESEQRIRELFEQAVAIAPCILFLDEIDAIAPHRATAQREMERRIVAQLLSCLDELSSKENGNKVLVLGATNRPDSLDPALRRAGRFDREVSLGIPDKEARAAILKVHTAKVMLSPTVCLDKIASLTPGFVGADLVALIREAAVAAVNRTFNELKSKNEPEIIEDVAIELLPASPRVSKVEEVVEKPVELEVADVVIEEESVKTDVAEIVEDKSSDEKTITSEEEKKVEEEKLEEEKKTEEQPAEEASAQPMEELVDAPLETLNSETEEIPQLELVAIDPVTETADVPIVDFEIPVSTTPAESTAIPEVDTTMSMQVEEVKKVDEEPKIKSVLKLEDLLAWLHNEPPFSPEQLAMLCVEERDFDVALTNVQPSAKREGFATVPDVTWDDVGSLQDIRQELQMTILAPIRHSEHFASLGLTTPTGVLLCGPPGCGKTLLAKAIANEAGINFISVKGPELLNMYVGESEKAVRQCFIRARNSAPCVIFFDELDALCPKRSEGDSTATSRVVNQMLTEMDGVEGRKGVFLMAASNRPDIIDPAVLRPGRLDKILYVGLPTATDRADILSALTKNGRKPRLGSDVSLEAIASSERCEGYTGADLAALVREAGVEALREIMNGMHGSAEICARHLRAAFDKIRPSVQDKDIKHYEKLKKLYSVKKYQNTDLPMSVEPLEPTLEAMET